MKLRARWPQRSVLLGISMVLAATVWMTGVAVAATQGVRLRYVPNEYIVHVQPGTSIAQVQDQVGKLGAGVVSALATSDTYLIRLGQTTGATAKASTTRSISSVTRWTIDRIQPNYLYYYCAVPNDPFWDKLWGMRMMNAPKAWDTQKGSTTVTVAVTDSGVAPHPDLVDRLLPGVDFFEPANTDGHKDVVGHGTHVAGTIAAQGDNGMGVCGVCWDGVWILPLRLGDENGLTDAAAINALNYIVTNKAAQVVNMSWGGYMDDPLLHAALTACYDAGIILVAAAGNDATETGYPASYPEVISVAALGPTESPAYYSNYGKIDIAAPGGDDRYGVDGEIYSTWVTGMDATPPNPVYSIEAIEGTSMACPHVTGAAALLLSQGVAPEEVAKRLYSTARPPATGSMTEGTYGAGIVDLYAALSNATLKIIKPGKGATVTSAPEFKVTVKGIDPTSLLVYLDYPDADDDGVPDDLTSYAYVVMDGIKAGSYVNATGTTLDFKWPLPGNSVLGAGAHKIYVTGKSASSGTVSSDWCSFYVSNRVIKAGVHLFAFPYSLLDPVTGAATVNPSDLLTEVGTANNVTFSKSGYNRASLMRWLPSTSVVRSVPYFQYFDGDMASKTTAEKLCWDNPWDAGFYTGGGFSASDSTMTKFPAGSGFWLVLPRDAQINQSYATMPTDNAFNIYLYAGWNMIGNPYDSTPAWGNTLFTYRGEGPKTLLQAEAAGWVRSNLFGWDSDTGRYVSVTARDLLDPFSGYWLYANVGSRATGDQLILTVQP